MDAVPQAPLLGVAAWAPVGGFDAGDGARHGCLTDRWQSSFVSAWCRIGATSQKTTRGGTKLIRTVKRETACLTRNDSRVALRGCAW